MKNDIKRIPVLKGWGSHFDKNFNPKSDQAKIAMRGGKYEAK